MDQGLATAIAAGIAAVASLVSLALTLGGAKNSEMRVAYRRALTPYLAPVAESLNETVACAVVMRKRLAAGKKDSAYWRKTGTEAARRLEAQRQELRYLEPRLIDPLRALVLFGDRVATHKTIPDTNVDELVAETRKLAALVNAAIARSYHRGKPVGFWRGRQLACKLKKVEALWAARPTRPRTPGS